MPESQKPRKQRQVVVKSQATANHINRKEFHYKKDETRLDFTLRVDIVDELENFKELMQMGIKDIDAELEKLKNEKSS